MRRSITSTYILQNSTIIIVSFLSELSIKVGTSLYLVVVLIYYRRNIYGIG